MVRESRSRRERQCSQYVVARPGGDVTCGLIADDNVNLQITLDGFGQVSLSILQERTE